MIYIHNFEGYSDAEHAAATVDNVREASRKLGKNLVEVQTNAREIFQEYVSWAHYHGSLLASVALLLAPQFQRIFIPSTHDVAQLFPWGSHPETDPYFSVEECKLIHDRYDVTRLEKTATLAASSVALEHLRVCWRPALNCGQCGKCVRTRLGLQALGISAASFQDGPLSLRQVRRISLHSEHSRKYILEIVDYLRDEKKQLELADAIDEARTSKHYRGWRAVLRWLTRRPRSLLLPLARRVGLR